MFKKHFVQSIIAGVLASIAGIIYYRIYLFTTEVDFSKVLNTTSIVSINVLACLLFGVIHATFYVWFKKFAEIIFNITISILSFAMIIVPISISLPLDIKNPELFPGLAVPMLFFPVLAWFTINPFFNTNK